LDCDRGECGIAIVSMACRLPGASDPDSLWDLVSQGESAITPVSTRWDSAAILDLDPDVVGKAYSLAGGYLSAVDGFDAPFFGIGQREAEAMDPQQRLLLETAWEALERADRDPRAFAGTLTGVYIGLYDSGYLAGSGLEVLNGHVVTGNAPSVASGRIAYALGLEGPALTVDTACSSSLVAIHLAAQALRRGECDYALAGGASIMTTPRAHVEFSRLRGLSPSGECKPFSAEADGVVWGEGCGLVLLKRMEDALRDGDHVLAVVRGSAVNQDGRSQGLSAPNGKAQEKVIRAAIADAGLQAGDIDYIEAHGTGTLLGDPIEISALARVFADEDPARRVGVGSLKSNLGHMQAAAGVAGLIKTVLALQNETLPASLHAEQPTPHVDWANSNIAVQSVAVAWPRGDRPRRAGVSAFGIGGTNAHLVVEEGPAPAPRTDGEATAESVRMLPISARSSRSLQMQAERLHAMVQSAPEADIGSLARSLALHRTHFERRAVVMANSTGELLDGLKAMTEAEDSPKVITSEDVALRSGKVAFVCPGQGAHWEGMARDLIEAEPDFSDELVRVDEAIQRYAGWSVLAVLRGDDGAPSLDVDAVVQPVNFAVSAALAAMWRGRGISPGAVVGHSQGEVAAAYIGGALSLDAAVSIIVLRSRLLADVVGAMAVVAMPEEHVRELLGSDLSVAAVNAPETTVVAGDAEALEQLLRGLQADKIYARRLAVGYASHTKYVDVIRTPLEAGLEGVSTEPAASTAWYSTVLGALVRERLDSEYWYRNLREKVDFAGTVDRMIADGYRYFIELSAHPSLTSSMAAIGENARRRVVAVGSLRRNEEGRRCLDISTAELHVGGLTIDWDRFVPAQGRARLPTYAWNHRSYWMQPESEPSAGRTVGDGIDHPILRTVVTDPEGSGATLLGTLAVRTQPWLIDHQVGGSVVYPAAGLVELALRAGAEFACDELEDLTLHAPIYLDAVDTSLQITVGAPDETGRRSIAVFSRGEGDRHLPWTRHADGVLRRGQRGRSSVSMSRWPPARSQRVDVEAGYACLADVGYRYGPMVRTLSTAWRRGADLFVEVALPAGASNAGFVVHPALLDAVFHALGGVALPPGLLPQPLRWAGVTLRSGIGDVVRARISIGADDKLSVVLVDEFGRILGEVESLELSTVESAQPRHVTEPTEKVSDLSRLAVPVTREHEVPDVDALRAKELSSLPSDKQEHVLLMLIQDQLSAVLGDDGSGDTRAEMTFTDMGIDSLGAVELRDRLQRATGIRLSVTSAMSHPTPLALARHIRTTILAEADKS